MRHEGKEKERQGKWLVSSLVNFSLITSVLLYLYSETRYLKNILSRYLRTSLPPCLSPPLPKSLTEFLSRLATLEVP